MSEAKNNNEIVFRVSFGSIDDSADLIITKDGRYNFASNESLKNDRTKYEVIYPDYRYQLVRVNQKYYKQALKAKKSMLKGDEEDWAVHTELYRKTLWLLSHNNLDGWEKTFNKLDAALGPCIKEYRFYCDMLYGDDSLREYREDEDGARGCLRRMKELVIESYPSKASAEEFEQLFKQERKKVMLVRLPQKDQNMVMYIDMNGYARRVECTGEQTKLAEKITQRLEKDKKFKHHKEYLDRVDGEELVNLLFDYAHALNRGENGYKQDRDLAYKIYTYLAKRWHQPDAFYNLGVFVQDGYGSLKKDAKAAIKYYEKAMEIPGGSCYHYAANNLGRLYATGQGVPVDEEKALKYYEIAMNRGDAFATASVAKFYEKGKIVERNRLYAWKLYNKAKELANDPDYKYDDVVLEFRDELEKDITRLEKKLK